VAAVAPGFAYRAVGGQPNAEGGPGFEASYVPMARRHAHSGRRWRLDYLLAHLACSISARSRTYRRRRGAERARAAGRVEERPVAERLHGHYRRRLRAGVANSAHDAPREPSCTPIQPDSATTHDATRK
jgi:hypothetical protein